MRILLLTAGSQGDVQPFVALGVGLLQAGYAVTICTSARFGQQITGSGLQFAPMDDRLLQLGDTAQGRAALEGSIRSRLQLLRQVFPLLRGMLDDAWTAAQDAHAIVYHPKALAGSHVAEKLAAPAWACLPVPALAPTAAFPNPIMPVPKLGGTINRWTYRLTDLAAAPYAGLINRWRKEVLQLPPRGRWASDLVRADGAPVPILYPFSPHVVPRPADWPDHVMVTGYWFRERHDQWQPPAALTAFFHAGPAPVYIGFGSMTGRTPERRAKLVIEAVLRAGQRAIVATGWGGLAVSTAPEQIFVLDAAPHDWLFPRCAAVVHHGGAGTTAAGLRAGKPTVICPFFGDQPFWGRRVQALGVGPTPIAQRKLTVDGLAAAIRTAATDDAMRERAHVLGEQIRAENGVARAVEVVTQRLQQATSKRATV